MSVLHIFLSLHYFNILYIISESKTIISHKRTDLNAE